MTPIARYLDPAVIQQVSRLDLRARFIVEGFLAGLHRSPFQGLSVEFAEHRKYAHGDDLRTLDWNVFARTDRLYVRRYAAETNLDCHLLVDASASMGYVGLLEGGGAVGRALRGGGTAEAGAESAAKLQYAIHIAAALGYLVTRQQDAVGVGVLGERLTTYLPPRSRRADLAQMLATLASIEPAGRTGLAAGIHEVLARIPHRGVIVLLSDLLTDTEATIEALHHVRFRGHDLIVMHILDVAEATFPFEGQLWLEDPESGQRVRVDAAGVRQRYLAGVEAWRASLKEQISAARADYVPLDTAMPFDRALVEFLTQRSRRR